MRYPDVKVEKIEVTDIFRVKHSAKSYYITIPRKLIEQYGLNSGHFLKIQIKEVRKPFEQEVDEK